MKNPEIFFFFLNFRFHEKLKFVLNLPVHFKVSHVNQCSYKPNRGGFPNAQKDSRNFSKIIPP